jgi:hypothetical protein
MSSPIMSANAPKIFRSRVPSMATSLCAPSIDSKLNSSSVSRIGKGPVQKFFGISIDPQQPKMMDPALRAANGSEGSVCSSNLTDVSHIPANSHSSMLHDCQRATGSP